jgi:hypothetical protein
MNKKQLLQKSTPNLVTNILSWSRMQRQLLDNVDWVCKDLDPIEGALSRLNVVPQWSRSPSLPSCLVRVRFRQFGAVEIVVLPGLGLSSSNTPRSMQSFERTLHSASFRTIVACALQLEVHSPMTFATRIELSCAVRAATSALRVFVNA